MKVQGMIVKPEEFNGNKYYSIFIVIEDKEYRLGTLKETQKGLTYINCMHKEFKK